MMFLPRNGKVGIFLDEEQALGQHAGNTHTRFPAAQALPSRGVPRGAEDALARWPGLPRALGTSVRTHADHSVSHVHKYPPSPTHVQ